MGIFNKIQDTIVFSPFLKKVAYSALINPNINNSSLYNLFYRRKMFRGMCKYSYIPHRLRIENTNICNANCIFCPHENMKREKGIMDMALFKKIIDDAAFNKISLVSIHGFGEPLLDKYFFERIKYAKAKKNKKIATNTNASFLNESNIQELLYSGLDEIYISFDAATENTYKKIRPGLDFFRVESNIKKLIEKKRAKELKFPKIYLSFIECSQNRNEVYLYYKKWRRFADGISISYLHNWGGKFSGEHLLKDTKRRDPCRLLWTDMAVSWDGRIAICCYDYENEIIIGDLLKEGIMDIWKGERLREFRQSHIEHQFDKINICKDCISNIHSKNPWWVVR